MLPPDLIPLLKRFEGLHKLGKDGLVHPYLCPAGFPTQGYGSLVASLDVPPITVEQAEAELDRKAAEHVAQALRLSPILATEPSYRLAAIASFVFNLGSGRYQASTLRKRVNARAWDLAAVELGKWVWGGGRKLPGLVLRRQAEASLLLGGPGQP